ncbi:hypothetical protein GYMLUDRAFT_124197, partial [Collybiopsis luxurians FD-317 M1]
KHILRACPRYKSNRYMLRDISPDTDILGAEERLTTLIEFIEDSGAFTPMGSPR